MMDRQRALADVVLQDPAVATVASFIGADGTNQTSNSGRLSITRTVSPSCASLRSSWACRVVDPRTIFL